MWDDTLKNIHIELISTCNLNCRFCANSFRKTLPLMTLDMFKEVIYQCRDAGITSIRLSPMTGEILLYPYLYDCLDFLETQDYIHQYGFYTNFSVPNIDIEKLHSYSKLKDIIVSINGNSEEEYKFLTRSNMFDIYYSNLEKLKTPKYNTTFRFEIKSKHWFEVFPLRGYIFKLLYLLTNGYNYSFIQESQLDNWAGYFTEQLKSFALSTKNDHTPFGECPVLKSKSIVLSDGSYLLCGCRDINYETCVGNILNTPLNDLLSQKYPVPDLCHKCTK